MHPPMRHADSLSVTRARLRLKARIDATGIPIAKLAERSGVSTGTIWRILRDDDRDIFLGTLAKLADALLIGVHELLVPESPDWEKLADAKARAESTSDEGSGGAGRE